MRVSGFGAGIVGMMLSLFVLPTLSGLFAAASCCSMGVRERGLAVHDNRDNDSEWGLLHKPGVK